MKRSEAVDILKHILQEVPAMISHYGEDEGCRIQAAYLLNKLENWRWLNNEEWEAEE